MNRGFVSRSLKSPSPGPSHRGRGTIAMTLTHTHSYARSHLPDRHQRSQRRELLLAASGDPYSGSTDEPDDVSMLRRVGLPRYVKCGPPLASTSNLPLGFTVTWLAPNLASHTHSEGPSKANSRPHWHHSQREAGCSTPIALCCSFCCEQGMAHPYDTHRSSCDAAFNVGYIIISHVGWRVACCSARATLHRRSVSSVRARPQPNSLPCSL